MSEIWLDRIVSLDDVFDPVYRYTSFTVHCRFCYLNREYLRKGHIARLTAEWHLPPGFWYKVNLSKSSFSTCFYFILVTMSDVSTTSSPKTGTLLPTSSLAAGTTYRSLPPTPSLISMPPGTPPRSPSPAPSVLSTAPGTPSDERPKPRQFGRRDLRVRFPEEVEVPDFFSDSNDIEPGTSTERFKTGNAAVIDAHISHLPNPDTHFDAIIPEPSVGLSGSTDVAKPATNADIDGSTSGPFDRFNDSPQNESHRPPLFDGPPVALSDVLRKNIPKVPDIYKKGALDKTRGSSTFDLDMPVRQQLKIVEFDSELIDRAEPFSRRKLEKFTVDPSLKDDIMFMTAIDPDCARFRNLPPRVCSEHDTEDLFFGNIARPALTAYEAVTSRSLRMVDPGDKKIHLTAGNFTVKTVPDALLDKGTSTRATAEIKTHNALKATAFSNFSELCNDKNPSAVKFVWPQKTSPKNEDPISVVETHEADLLVQVSVHDTPHLTVD